MNKDNRPEGRIHLTAAEEKSLLASFERSIPDLKRHFKAPAREPEDKAGNAKLAREFTSASELAKRSLDQYGLPIEILYNVMYSKMPQVMGIWFMRWKENGTFENFAQAFYREFLDQIPLTAFAKYLNRFEPLEGNTLLATARELKQFIEPATILMMGTLDRHGAQALIFDKIKEIMGAQTWNSLVQQKAKIECLDDVINFYQECTGAHNMALQAITPDKVGQTKLNNRPEEDRAIPELKRANAYRIKPEHQRGNFNRPNPYRNDFQRFKEPRENRENNPNPKQGEDKNRYPNKSDNKGQVSSLHTLFEDKAPTINQTAYDNGKKLNNQGPPIENKTPQGRNKLPTAKKEGLPPPCTDKDPCDYCGKQGHNSFKCCRRTLDYGLPYPDGVPCFTCYALPGHYLYQCDLCAQCRQPGHQRKDCTNPPADAQKKSGNGQRAYSRGPSNN